MADLPPLKNAPPIPENGNKVGPDDSQDPWAKAQPAPVE